MAMDKLGSELCDVPPFTIYGQAVPRVLERDNLAVGRANPSARPLSTQGMNTAVPSAMDNEQRTAYL